jgi:hypothetical protein
MSFFPLGGSFANEFLSSTSVSVKLIKVDLNKYFISLLNFEESQLE